MCPLDSRVCVSSASQSLATPASFTGLWKESSWGGDEAAGLPALPADGGAERRAVRDKHSFLPVCSISTSGPGTFSVSVVVLWNLFAVLSAPASRAVAQRSRGRGLP